jgi:hypothetical protein
MYKDLQAIVAQDKLRNIEYEALKKSGKTPKVAYEADAPFMRYFWITSSEKFYEDFLIVLGVQVNLLSTKGVITLPVLIAPDVARIDIRDYNWHLTNAIVVWEKTAGIDFVFHQLAIAKEELKHDIYWPGGKDPSKEDKFYERGAYEITQKKGSTFTIPSYWSPQAQIDYAREVTYSESPMLMAEWFFVQTARQISIRNEEEGIGYNDFLGLKKRDDFFKVTGTNPKLAKDIFSVWRSAMLKRNLSQQNRQGGAIGSASRRVWFTLDTFRQKGRGVLLRNLRDGEFAHNAEEWFGFLPNGLWITLLSDNKGVVVASAPDKIGPDDSGLNKSRDHRVHANLSCIRCHGPDKDMLKGLDDVVRRRFRDTGFFRLVDENKDVALELKSEYLRDIQELLEDDRILYVRGLRKATTSKLHPKGLTTGQFARLYAAAWDRYVEKDLTAEDAARELGTTKEEFLKNLKAHFEARGASDNVLSAFLDQPPDTVSRLDWEDTYAFAMTIALGLQAPEQKRFEKKVDVIQ